MNKAVVTIAVITFVAVVGVYILNTLPKEQNNSLEQKTQILDNKHAFEDPPETVLTELGIEDAVREYLKDNVAVSSFGDEVFCSFEVIGHDTRDKKLNAYLWILCSELYVSDREIKEGAGVSEPVFIACEENESDGYYILRHAVPVDGAGYAKSVANIFPSEYVKEMFPFINASLLTV